MSDQLGKRFYYLVTCICIFTAFFTLLYLIATGKFDIFLYIFSKVTNNCAVYLYDLYDVAQCTCHLILHQNKKSTVRKSITMTDILKANMPT